MGEIPDMETIAVINIQEDKMEDVAVVIEWVLVMTAVQSIDMEVAITNLQEGSTETTVPAIGELVAAIGELAAMKVVMVTEDILKINIWEEDRTNSGAMMMIIIVPAEVIVGTAELPEWEGKAAQDLLAGAVAVAVIGKTNFRRPLLKR